MTIIFILTFISGLFLGSFLKVLIDRLPRGESVLISRSHCEKCHHILKWYDLIPFFSFIQLKGKCRYCHRFFGFEYPLIEIFTGILLGYTVVFTLHQSLIIESPFIALQIIYFIFMFSTFIVIFFTDLKFGIILDVILYPALIATVIYQIFFIRNLIIVDLAAAFGSGLFFFSLFAITRGRGMGFGDVKLSVLLGLFLGIPKTVVALYIAFLTGAIVALILILEKKKKLRGSTIPFGPFLIFGILISFYYGDVIWGKIIQLFYR